MALEPYIGQIQIFAGNFAPRGWALCNGQLLSIQQNTALFSLIGIFYGGNGTSNFALPDLQGAAPLFFGQGPGLSSYVIGQQGGSENVTLLSTQVPAHTHVIAAASEVGESSTPSGRSFARANIQTYVNTPPNATATVNTNVVGGGLPHNNMQPYLALTFIIALQGIFPPRQ
jgi:microcystin-dependent protein